MHVFTYVRSERLQRTCFCTHRWLTAGPALPARVFLQGPGHLVRCHGGECVQRVLLVVLLKELQDDLKVRLSLLEILIKTKKKSNSGLEFCIIDVMIMVLKSAQKCFSSLPSLLSRDVLAGGGDKSDFEMLGCPGSYYTRAGTRLLHNGRCFLQPRLPETMSTIPQHPNASTS